MFQIHEQTDSGPEGDDAASLVARHDELDSSFWIERDDVLIVNHVSTGAEGFFCLLQRADGGEPEVAIARDPRHGLALTYDGGGNWMVIDRGCVIDRAAAIAVVDEFMRTGGRSDAVAWGAGLVRTSVSDEDGWVVTEVGKSSGPYGWLPGGFRGEIGGEVDASLPDTATWRVLAELVVHDTPWLAVLAARPMTVLRRLEVWNAKDLSGLAEAVAALPALEHLVVFGPAVLSMPPLSSPTLRQLSLAVADINHEPDEEPEGWRAQIEARVQACSLPRLEATEIVWVVDTSGL